MRALKSGVAAAVLLSACGGDATTVFTLERAGSDTLPYLLRQDSVGCNHMLHDGQVEFDRSGTYRSSFDIRKVCGGVVTPVDPPNASGSVRVSGDSAYFSAPGGASNGVGVLTSDSLIVQGALHRLVYVRRLNP